MAGKKSDLGPSGITVMTNVKRLRGDMSYAELARRLEKLGRPIPPLGLRRIESGNRRVDADDLVALAAALGVSPVTLLNPDADDQYDPVQVTGVGTLPAHTAHSWFLGTPLPGTSDADYWMSLVRSAPTWGDVRRRLLDQLYGRYEDVTLVRSAPTWDVKIT